MKLSVLGNSAMSISGSSLKRQIQNTSLSNLDLIVRESIQNIMDARLPESRKACVDFIIGSCDRRELDAIFKGISDSLRKIPGTEADYLAVKDSCTTGLTGPLTHKEILNLNDCGNLRKLIYEICKPQQGEGKGGSWGIGKTVYFRAGIGIVLYYSRIKTAYGYESRLAASLIEDESGNCLVKSAPTLGGGKLYTGVAWWGDIDTDKNPMPITDDKEILEILEIFGIEEFTDDETGTCIIIPYINKDELVHDANRQDSPMMSNIPLDRYIKLIAQRWYFPILDNNIPSVPYLEFKVNGSRLRPQDWKPLFRKYQELYNRSFSADKNNNIRILNQLHTPCAGYLMWNTENRTTLQMTAPNNELSPYLLIGKGDSSMNDDADAMSGNAPIVCFCRQPGMIVNYATESSDWTLRVPNSASDEYVIAIFRLNSDNKLKNRYNVTLEEYVRKAEPADHMRWEDSRSSDQNYTIVERIKRGVSNKLSNELKPKKDDSPMTAEGFLQKSIGKLLLPPEGFGKRPAVLGKVSASKYVQKITASTKYATLAIGRTVFGSDNRLTIHWSIKLKKDKSAVSLVLSAVTSKGTVSANQWEDDTRGIGTEFPFSVCEVKAEYFGTKLHTEMIKSRKDISCGIRINTSGITAVSGKKREISGSITFDCNNTMIAAKLSLGDEEK